MTAPPPAADLTAPQQDPRFGPYAARGPSGALCPQAHDTATGPATCPTCGAPLGAPATGPARKPYHAIARWVAVAVVVVAVVAGVVVLIFTVEATRSPSIVVPSNREAMKNWWSQAQPAVTDLQESLYDSESALRRFDGPALTGACQRMHDTAAVGVPAQLPAPDRKLTAELTAAADDAHAAAHMCLALVEKSPNNYDGEFSANLAQAEKQLKAALTLVNRTLTTQPRWDARGKQ